jgi:HEAT repeat protein
VAALAEAMRGTNIVLCRLAAKALSQVGPPALATLIAHLQHVDPFVRGEAALALGWMGAQARSAIPFLSTAVRGSRTVSDRTPPPGKLMAEFRTPTTPPVITPPPEGGNAEENARIYAAQALGRIGALAATAMPELREATRSGSDALRLAAHTAIRLIEGV